MVDDVCEEIRLGLEEEDFTQDQRRLAYVKFLGELYTYQVIGSQVVFDTLYLFITYGLTDDESEFYFQNQGQSGAGGDGKNSDNNNNNNNNNNNKPNPNWLSRSDIHWKYCFRAQLCCELLQTCGVYLRSGKLHSRCDRFLLYFQRFIVLHSPLPLDIQWWVDDVMQYVAPDIEKHTTLESVLKAIADLERKELASDKVHRDALVAITDEDKEGDDEEDEDLDDIDDDEDEDDEEEDEEDIDESSARILEDEDDTADADGYTRRERITKHDRQFMDEYDQLISQYGGSHRDEIKVLNVGTNSRQNTKTVSNKMIDAKKLIKKGGKSGGGRKI